METRARPYRYLVKPGARGRTKAHRVDALGEPLCRARLAGDQWELVRATRRPICHWCALRQRRARKEGQ